MEAASSTAFCLERHILPLLRVRDSQMLSVLPEDGVNRDEMDPLLLLMDRGSSPLPENSFRTMVSNLTTWCPDYSSAITVGAGADMDDAVASGSSTSSQERSRR